MTYIPYGKQSITKEDVKAVTSVLNSDYLTGGPFIKKFEDRLSEFTEAKHAIACSSGTAALHLSLMAIECTKNDAIIVPSLTFAATANSVIYCGGTPIFADIDPATKTISPESIEEAIDLAKSKGLQLKAVIAVHYAGLSSDMKKISDIARSYNMFVIEDACHAIGGQYENRPIGSCIYSDICCFSFHPVKHITTGEGGALTTNSDLLCERVSVLRSHGISKDPDHFQQASLAMSEEGLPNPWYQEMALLGFNYRLSDIQASLGYSQLSQLHSSILRRREVAEQYYQSFADIDWIQTSSSNKHAEHAYHLFTIDIDFSKTKLSKAKMMNGLSKEGIGTQVHYLPVFLHLYYQSHKNLWYKVEQSNTLSHYKSTISIPMYSSLSSDEVKKVVESLKGLGTYFE